MAAMDGPSGFSLRQRERRQSNLRGAGHERDEALDAPPPLPQASASSSSNQLPLDPAADRPPQDRRSREAERRRNRSGSAEPRQRSRGAKNDNTANLVRKRYSVRYNAPPTGLDGAPPMPGLPPVPPQHGRPPGSSEGGPPQEGPPPMVGMNLQLLRETNLDAEEFAAQFLAHATEKDLAVYQQDLRKIQTKASSDLQASVYQNRTQFIRVSKEAERLKTEMTALQGFMNELSSTLEQAGWSGGSRGGEESGYGGRRMSRMMSAAGMDEMLRKRSNRSSVANLEAMWNAQLQAMWKLIEGSQKYIAAIPGRHVLLEMDGWQELDAATWKVRRPAHLVLLNDHLLVATRKRKRIDQRQLAQMNGNEAASAPTKLVAERCWPLAEIELIDLTATAKEVRGPLQKYNQITGAITIRRGPESCTYRSERSNGKNKDDFVIAFKRAVETLRRTERDASAKHDAANRAHDTMNYLVSRDPALAGEASLLRSLGQSARSARASDDMLINFEGKQRNLRWVEGQMDELDLAIAVQRFDDAVSLIEQLRSLARGLKGNSVAQELVTVKVDERASNLADTLTQLLIANHSHPTPTQAYTSFLTRLAFTARARLAYLSARSDAIQVRARGCIFQGDVLAHITALSLVHFTLMRNTVANFHVCFPQPGAGSAVVVWASGELEKFNNALRGALAGVEQGGEAWKMGLLRARDLAGILEEVGVDFAGMVGVGIAAPLQSPPPPPAPQISPVLMTVPTSSSAASSVSAT